MTVVTHRRLHTGFGEDFGPRADGFVTGHTWEGKTLTVGTVAQFLAPGGPRDWQDADSVLGAYNLVICADGVVETVQWDHASGGINPSSSGFKPRAWLYEVADRDEIHNPNNFSLQLCFFVSKAYCDANGWPPYMIDAAARAWIEEEKRTGRKQVWNEHADFQPPPNRFDCGPIATALIKKRYAELTAPETDMPIITRTVREQWDIPAGTVLWTGGPGMGEKQTFDVANRLWSNGETADGKWRRIEGAGPTQGQEFYVYRWDMKPVPGTRNPAIGFGPADSADAAALEVAKQTIADLLTDLASAKDHARAIVALRGHA